MTSIVVTMVFGFGIVKLILWIIICLWNEIEMVLLLLKMEILF